MRSKKVFIMIPVAAVLLGAVIYGVTTFVFGSKDENIENYKAALSKTMQGEMFHYTQSKTVTDISGEPVDVKYNIEVYKLGSEFIRIDTSEIGKHYLLNYEDYTYQASLYEDGEVYVHKDEGLSPHKLFPNEVDITYFSIDDRYVTYEKTDTEIIVTYENNFLIGKRTNGAYYEEDKDGYTSAVSVAYFDKEWNLQKLEVTEKWISITEDGQEYERAVKITVHYYETSEDEIEKIFEETKTMLDDLME